MAWQQGGGYYPGGQAPPPAGFYPGGFPQQGGYPPPGSYPQQPGGYPQQPGGYPQQPGYPPQQPGYPTQQQGFAPAVPVTPHILGGYSGGSAQPGGMHAGYSSYGEDPLSGAFDFSDKSVRRGFIRKVYGILMCQLMVTLGIISLFTFHKGTQVFVRNNPSLSWVALIVMFVCMIVMACCGDVRRKAPMNFIFLGIFTLAESFLLGCVATSYAPLEVLMAVGICAIVTLSLTLFAFQTKIDFTMMGGVLFVCAIILMIFGIVTIFWHGKIITLVYASFGALLFSIYIVYDTQIMMGGTHKYSISPEEYIFAALNLYLDIVNLFLYILTIIGASRD